MTEARAILKTHWGYPDFREPQEEIIERVLANEDILALLPTGGGKSICFQIPALVRPGICIVVSPLIALMEDQVNTLKEKNIKAMAITGGISFPELDKMLDNCIYGKYKFLYLSPERLQQDIVMERIRQMDVNLVAIDESHCISQWGHDFRPSYLHISMLRELKPEVNFIALTASATKPVIGDIISQLDLREPVIIKKSFERKNISYSVEHADDKLARLEKLLLEHKESAIVYVGSRRATVEISEYLKSRQISAAAFHGGITRKEKSLRLKEWLSGKNRIMVATGAFGMGIDKPNVRTVIHMQLPDSLENYFQEAGRAGRDGKFSQAVILMNSADIPLLKDRFIKNLPEIDFVRLIYRRLMSYFRIAYGEGEGIVENINFSDFCNTYGLHILKTYNTLQLLDRAGILQLTEHYRKKTFIRFIITPAQLRAFIDKNLQFQPVVNTILRSYGGTLEAKTEIDLKAISTKAGSNLHETVKVLSRLNNEEIAEFEHDMHDLSIGFLLPREDELTINPIIPYIRSRSESKKNKIAAVIDYIKNNDQCKSEQLLKYFGESRTTPCGICSVCQNSTAQNKNRKN